MNPEVLTEALGGFGELNLAFLIFPSAPPASVLARRCPALVAFCSTLVSTVKPSFRVATQEAAVILLEKPPLRPQHPQALGFSGGEGQHRTVTTGVTAKAFVTTTTTQNNTLLIITQMINLIINRRG